MTSEQTSLLVQLDRTPQQAVAALLRQQGVQRDEREMGGESR